MKWFGLLLILALSSSCAAPDGSPIMIIPAREYYSVYLAGARDECFKQGIDDILRMDIPINRMMFEMLAISCAERAQQLLRDQLIPIIPEKIPNIMPTQGQAGT
jgi:hypothetical protein